ncbi:unnamed protein product [Phytophthora fragariaefolia]|uniref:Unnamed protein product n=1 Tax=Phytophthora fragariaefolia TaxID=1490495 RepID=A0A9W6XJN3_9STRA|nr:unnamed protein product [Phytophthora fragariaefolia]
MSISELTELVQIAKLGVINSDRNFYTGTLKGHAIATGFVDLVWRKQLLLTHPLSYIKALATTLFANRMGMHLRLICSISTIDLEIVIFLISLMSKSHLRITMDSEPHQDSSAARQAGIRTFFSGTV